MMPRLVMRPPLLGPAYEPHDIPTLSWESPPRHAVKVGVNRLKISIGITHDGLPEVVDAVADMAWLRKMDRLGSIHGGIIPMANGILV